MIYFLSEQRIKTDFLNDNMDSDLILNAIRESQDIYLRQIIGDSLYNTLSRLIENDLVVEPYKNLLDNFIIIYLEYKTLSSLCVTSTFKLSNMGMAQAYDNNINTQSMQSVKYLQSHYDSKASFYENRLTEYLNQNINSFPDYKNYKDITTSRSTTSQSGLFLGGARTITTINDINMVHDNTVRSYVRYDTYQNLSETQKATARENIGVSANGSIDINLDNYYNKQEINTKLEPYATTNEVNSKLNNYYTKSQTDTAIQNAVENVDVDLSNYYDKSTVNNLLDNLPIPEATSELVKDDVYTKSEVYTKGEVDIKIANVSSGGSVDLSNYYNKQETESLIENAIDGLDIPTKTSDLTLDNTYSRTQVDTLINQIPTFSGNYEDLTNKPSIYTKNEIDTLISNINEFSGDYNDLTNKPDVYTKSQTDTAIQTAVNGIETFSGNYNDLTNKPTLFSGSYNDLSDKPTIPTDTAQLSKSDIYTKAETFTRQEIVDMINEINYSDINNTPTLSTVATSGNYGDLNNLPTLFSGSYSDLTNTPEIYTKSETYNKSEIDLQFAEINTTLGNINNLLETI